MRKYQRNRVYSLVVGNEDGAIEINNLQIKFNVTKTSDNSEKKNSATVEIYNLSDAKRTALELPYVQVQLKVGWAGEELTNLFTGQVINISNTKIKSMLSKRNGLDIITKLDLDEMYSTLNHKIVSKIVPEGRTVRDLILEIVSDIPEVTRHEMNGKNIDKTLPDGYPIQGSPQSVLDRVSKAYDIEWQIDEGVLFISDKFGSYMKDSAQVPLISEVSGMIGAPEFVSSKQKRQRQSVKQKNGSGDSKKKGNPRNDSLKIVILMNPSLTAGSYFKLEFPDLTGYYKIDEVKHKGDFRGRDWYSELTCSVKLEGQ